MTERKSLTKGSQRWAGMPQRYGSYPDINNDAFHYNDYI